MPFRVVGRAGARACAMECFACGCDPDRSTGAIYLSRPITFGRRAAIVRPTWTRTLRDGKDGKGQDGKGRKRCHPLAAPESRVEFIRGRVFFSDVVLFVATLSGHGDSMRARVLDALVVAFSDAHQSPIRIKALDGIGSMAVLPLAR